MGSMFGVHRVPSDSARRRRLPRWFVPATRLGRWSIALLTAFFALFVGLVLAAQLGDPFGSTETGFLDRPLLAVFGVGAALTGSMSGVTALLAVAFRRERSLSVLAALLIGGLVLVFLVGESFGHD